MKQNYTQCFNEKFYCYNWKIQFCQFSAKCVKLVINNQYNAFQIRKVMKDNFVLLLWFSKSIISSFAGV